MNAAMQAVMASGRFIGGKAVEQFEAEFAAYCGTTYAIGVGNGTDALHLALLALEIGPGDEVITVPNTFIATVAAIALTGATAVLCDIDPKTYCLDANSAAAKITPRTKAILPVHLYGHIADMDALQEIAAQHNLFILEDCAQAHGAYYKGRRAGSLGNLAAFSFYPSKNLGACGDGGAVTTNDPALAQKMHLLRNHGRSSRYEHTQFAFNSQLDAVQSSILSVKLRHLEGWNARRREIAARYDALLWGLPGLVTPTEAEWAEHVYHLYVVRTRRRAALQAALTAAEIEWGVHYPLPIHLQPAWTAAYGDALGPGAFPRVERYAAESLSLPMHPYLSDAQVDYVAQVVREVLCSAEEREQKG
ncbi:MAG: DegT/DnrJ/EryC1/StrS family aminotransferase, partial [Armatimonadota bacterium]|nr:DegT/DnrJ/EryC1/StrS family aminotransferase [Armatimonadota bacterium]